MRAGRRERYLIVVLLAGSTWFVYDQVRGFDFVNYDDPMYVVQNPRIRKLNSANIGWAFSTTHAHNWHPLTWVSYMIDTGWFGGQAAHHITNVVLHGSNAVLLFVLLNRLTRAVWKSGFVAAVFAVHPLHVESVAWVSERKDVLSVFFGLIALLAYERYARDGAAKAAVSSPPQPDRDVSRQVAVETTEDPSPGWRHLAYLLALFAFGCSLMSKQMLVTLPCLLLVLDWWPMRRVSASPAGLPEFATARLARWKPLVVEKIPFFGLAALFGAIIYTIQGPGRVTGDEEYPFGVRISNAVLAYGLYLKKSIWPDDLAAFYPHPGESISLTAVAVSAFVLLAISVIAISRRRRNPALLAGWLWFLGTLVPVIGLVQVGEQQMADRYMYFPQIGLVIMAAWGTESIVSSVADRAAKLILPTIAAAAFTALAIAARFQTATWKDSEALFGHAVAVNDENHFAHDGLGLALMSRGEVALAMSHFRRSLELKPGYASAHQSLGNAYSLRRKYRQAVPHYRAILKKKPADPQAMSDLGHALLRLRRYDEALVHLRNAVELVPGEPLTRSDLAEALLVRGEVDEALAHAKAALRTNPNLFEARVVAGLALERKGRLLDSLEELDAAIQINHNDFAAREAAARVRYRLGLSAADAGDIDRAATFAVQALQLSPDGPQTHLIHSLLGRILAAAGQATAADRHFQQAVKRNRDSAEVRLAYGMFLLARGHRQQAREQLQEAVRLRPNDQNARGALRRAEGP